MLENKSDKNHSDSESLKEAMWWFHQGVIKGLIDTGAQGVFSRTQGIEHIHQTEGHVCIGCMDERIGKKEVGIAGSGILWGAEKTIEAVKRNGITQISSHTYCAAAVKAALDKYGSEEDADKYAQDFAMEVAAGAGIEYIGHLDPNDFNNPRDTHITGIVYYTNRPLVLDKTELPKGFLVTQLSDDPTGALKDVSLAVNIARGGHGFGPHKLYGDTPALLIGIADSSKDADEMRRQLSHVQSQFSPKAVAIDTVVLQ